MFGHPVIKATINEDCTQKYNKHKQLHDVIDEEVGNARHDSNTSEHDCDVNGYGATRNESCEGLTIFRALYELNSREDGIDCKQDVCRATKLRVARLSLRKEGVICKCRSASHKSVSHSQLKENAHTKTF